MPDYEFRHLNNHLENYSKIMQNDSLNYCNQKYQKYRTKTEHSPYENEKYNEFINGIELSYKPKINL